jgi:hypothetical protein
MKKPSLRVTKWLGDIPVAAECTSCAGVAFEVKSASHRPTREEYQKSLQSQFDAHRKKVHTLQDPRQTAAPAGKEATEDKSTF